MCITKIDEAEFIPQAKMQRVLNLIMTLYTNAYTPAQIASLLDCSERTAYRYIKLIESIGISVDSDLGRHYFIAQDDCPLCHGLIKGENGEFAIPVSSTE
jgi:biotin operon repressor